MNKLNYLIKVVNSRNTWLEEVTKFWELYPEGIIDLG